MLLTQFCTIRLATACAIVWLMIPVPQVSSASDRRCDANAGEAPDLRRVGLETNRSSSGKWTRTDTFYNAGSCIFEARSVEFTLLNPEALGFGNVTNENVSSVQAAAIEAFPEVDFFGVSFWVDGDSPVRFYENNGSSAILNLTLQPGDSFTLTTIAEFSSPGCTDCVASTHAELVVGWTFELSSETRCGDGYVDVDEECDDGNTHGNDCCSASCRLEAPGSECGDSPAECTANVCDQDGYCQEIPTCAAFHRQIRSKMYIAQIELSSCDPQSVLGPPVLTSDYLRLAAYVSFCEATNRFFGEDPKTGDASSPLDARVLSIVDLDWVCDATKTIPVAGSVSPSTSIGGPEPLELSGATHPILVEDNITSDGTWEFVSSGRPNPVLEALFQIHWLRLNPDIWHRITGRISCRSDRFGQPDAVVSMRFAEATPFPSHRSYFHDVDTYPETSKIGQTLQQGAFSNLWFLPARPSGSSISKATAQMGCSLEIPVLPVAPHDYWGLPASNWCSQLHQCGLNTQDCVEIFLAAIENPPGPIAEPPNDSTMSSPPTSITERCNDSIEHRLGEVVCLPEPASAALAFASLAGIALLRRREVSGRSWDWATSRSCSARSRRRFLLSRKRGFASVAPRLSGPDR